MTGILTTELYRHMTICNYKTAWDLLGVGQVSVWCQRTMLAQSTDHASKSSMVYAILKDRSATSDNVNVNDVEYF